MKKVHLYWKTKCRNEINQITEIYPVCGTKQYFLFYIFNKLFTNESEAKIIWRTWL